MAQEAQEPIGLRLQWSVYLSGAFGSSIAGQMHVVLPLWLAMLHPSPLMIGIVLASRTFLPFLLAIPAGTVMDKIGARLSVFSLVGALVTPSVGPLARRVSNAWLLVGAVGGSIVAVVATPLLGSYAILMAAIAFRGSMIGLVQPLVISMISQAAAAGDQGKGVGLRATANRLAVTFTPVLMGGVVEIVGLENAFYVIGAILLSMLMGVANYVKCAPGLRT